MNRMAGYDRYSRCRETDESERLMETEARYHHTQLHHVQELLTTIALVRATACLTNSWDCIAMDYIVQRFADSIMMHVVLFCVCRHTLQSPVLQLHLGVVPTDDSSRVRMTTKFLSLPSRLKWRRRIWRDS